MSSPVTSNPVPVTADSVSDDFTPSIFNTNDLKMHYAPNYSTTSDGSILSLCKNNV